MTLKHFMVQGAVWCYAVCFHKSLACFIVTLRLYALNLSKQLAKEFTHLAVIIHLKVVLAIFIHPAQGSLFLSALIHPCGYKLAVTHVRLLHIFSHRYAYKLRHHTVEYIAVVGRLVRLHVWKYSKFHHLRVCHEVQPKQVCTCLFKCGTVAFKRILRYALKQLS